MSNERLVEAIWGLTDAVEETLLRRPSMIFKPRVFQDGDQWCALYGANIQEGVAGFGPTPEAACRDFDAHWLRGRHGRDHSEDLQGSARQNGDV